MSLTTLRLLQTILHSQQISAAADEADILAVVAAKRELAAALAAAEAAESA